MVAGFWGSLGNRFFVFTFLYSFLLLTGFSAASQDEQFFIRVSAKDKFERSQLTDAGMSIEFIRSDQVGGFVTPRALQRIQKGSFKIHGIHPPEFARGGHGDLFSKFFDFPNSDARYHNYEETIEALEKLHRQYPKQTALEEIGQSIEGRRLVALHLNTSEKDLKSGFSSKPGIVFLGTHHAREHLSTEIPLLLSEYLLKQRERLLSSLLANRDIWIIPMVNPDGVEWDIEGGRYKYWRKNRRPNLDGTRGVDLNRNYGYKWGTGGSSQETDSEIYMGSEPFSEPETQAVRDFISLRSNLKVLLSFHTYSELILYPWGNTYDPIANPKDLQTFQNLASRMARWNHYTPQPSSDLYIASGDTTDWAYGEHGIFAFTFELSPASGWFGGGFYPGSEVVDHVFRDNVQPCLYLIDMASNPYRALHQESIPQKPLLWEPTEKPFWEIPFARNLQ